MMYDKAMKFDLGNVQKYEDYRDMLEKEKNLKVCANHQNRFNKSV